MDLGNSFRKSVSPSPFNRNPMPIELRSDGARSGVERDAEGVEASSGSEATNPSISISLRLGFGHANPRDKSLSPAGLLLTQVLPNSLHFRQGTLLSHLTFNLEHSSQA